MRRAVVVAQLAERSLARTEVRVSNPVSGNVYWTKISCQLFCRKDWDREWPLLKIKSWGIDLLSIRRSVWPDWAIYSTLGNFFKPLATINLPQSSPFLGNYFKGVKSFIFLVKPFLGNFYKHLAIFIWSHCRRWRLVSAKMVSCWKCHEQLYKCHANKNYSWVMLNICLTIGLIRLFISFY